MAIQIGYPNGVGTSPAVTVQLAAGSLNGEMGKATQKHEATLRKKLLEIVQGEAFTKVARLEKRRADAERTIEAMNQRITQLRERCATEIAQDGDCISEAAKKMAATERAIAEARLTLESVATALPAAIEERNRVAKVGVAEAVAALKPILNETQSKADAAIHDRILAPVADHMAVDQMWVSISQLLNSGADGLLRFVGRAEQL